MIIGGIFGPKLSGKTTVAKALSRTMWTTEQRRSIVLDPNNDDWGEQAKVYTDEKAFWDAVWQTQSALIIVDEAAATIRRERALVPAFTRIRHQRHKVIVIGHSGIDLLPVMRQQIDVLFLFRQPESAAKVWAETFADKRLYGSTELKQFEFIRCELYGNPQKMILKNPNTGRMT